MSVEINNYANSMFQHEVINNEWIDKCAEYLKKIFGTKIQDKVVLDYAFGRGNWSLAFIKAGAKKVISVDASIDNVARFQNYINKNSINHIELQHGNFLVDSNYDYKIDVFWIYGILHHIDNASNFLNILKKFENENCIYHIYVYPKNSLRHFLVESSRKLLGTKIESHYKENYTSYTNEARKRVRDDLVAPYIRWYTLDDLTLLLSDKGLYIEKVDIDFYEFMHGDENFEFYPIQVLCNNKVKLYSVVNQQNKLYDIDILHRLFSLIFIKYNKLSESRRESLVVGLNNTYYAALLKNDSNFLIESLFIYLSNIVLNENIFSEDDELNSYLNLLMASVEDRKRDEYYSILGKNIITKYLVNNRTRL